MTERKGASGFTITELIITVATIVLAAALALPNLLRSRIAANESAAIESIRQINEAQTSYAAAHRNVGYASSLAALGPGAPPDSCAHPDSSHACLLNDQIAHASSAGISKDGYWFSVSITGRDVNALASGYVVTARPAVMDKTGMRYFCSTEDRVIRFRVPGQGSNSDSASGCLSSEILH